MTQRTSGTKPERVLAEAVRKAGYPTPEVAPKDVLGKPDLVWRKERVAVFVDGCYWHGCPIHYKLPNKRRAWWRRKLERNKIRDRGVAWRCHSCGTHLGMLPERGWKVLRVWEHDVLGDGLERTVIEIGELLKCRR